MIVRCLIFLTMLFTPLLVAAQIPAIQKDIATTVPAGSSVLATGKWFKMKIKQTGVYRLSYEDIVEMGFSDPSNISVFGNGGTMLPLINGMPRYDDLVENPVYMFKGADGIFNQGDYILFYGLGPVSWSYDADAGMFLHKVHQFSAASYYFVTDNGQQLRIVERPVTAGTASLEIRSFTDFSFHERNRYNFLESGRQWFGDRIDYTPFDSVFIFDGLVASSPVKIKMNVVSRSDGNRVFTLAHENSIVGTINITPVNLQNKTGAFANQKDGYFTLLSNDDRINLRLTYNKTGSEDEGYLDYITINVRRRLSLSGDVMLFRDTTAVGTGVMARYVVENCTPQTEIWDVSNPFGIVKVPAQLSGTTLIFTDSTNTLREFIVLKTGAAFSKPVTESDDEDTGIIPNQNLHSLGSHRMLIVTHPDFIAAADSIADFHRENDNLTVAIATTEQIYNEFSSGAPDVSAIRDFAKMIYDRATGNNDRLSYLLLIGDGSYNNLSASAGNSNFILTYQSENSLNASFSYVSDDFFGLMEDSEGGSNFMEDFSLDLGIGRLPVKTAEEAMAIYRKIKRYSSPLAKGDWQNNILFAGDDGDGNLHMRQSNELANWVDLNYPEFAVKKVFMDAYPQVASSTGTRYPDVNRTIINNIEKGLLIFNYTGHGGEIGLADEQILMREDLVKLTNINHLPLFITATCEFSRFDDLTRSEDGTLTESTSAGEFTILNPNGGSIALVTTTRIVYSSENHELNSRFLQIALDKDDGGNYRTLGEIIRMTKNVLGESRNKLNFILLGDPALKLAVPAFTVITDSLNHIPVTQPTDTLKAFSKVTITGHIEDHNHNILTSFDGIIYPSVFDKKKTVTTLANDVGSFPMEFTTREDLLYKGKASVTGGRFTFEFIVPKDITYNFGKGKIIYFSHNSEIDSKGEFSNFIIGGTDRTAEPDYAGPLISLYLNDELFNNEGITSPNPVIYAKINDESGINTIGNGIGHDITGVIDGIGASPIVMNDYFETMLDDYTSGTLTYPMHNLEEGVHSLKLKVWDIYNNSSEATIEFKVVSGNRIIISRAGNYPNPARDHTTFTFEHNKADEELIVTISVFDLGGRLLFNYSEKVLTSGFNSSPPLWDLKDMNGNALKPGIYPYRIRIADSKGVYADSYQKLVVIR